MLKSWRSLCWNSYVTSIQLFADNVALYREVASHCSIVLPDGHVEAGGIQLLRGGINSPVIVLMCCVGLRRNYLSVSTLCDILNKRTSLKFSDFYHHMT